MTASPPPASSPSDPFEDSDLRAALSRRNFLKGAGGAAAGGVLARALTAGAESPVAIEGEVETLAGPTELTLTINGSEHRLKIEPRTTLLDVLRVHCSPPLTGTKLVCDRGNCGACTVHIDGEPAYACLLLAADLRGRAIGTIEGLGSPAALTPLQHAFWEQDAAMCGFCTPGFVMSISACLAKHPSASLDEIKQACSGNVCRCGTYPHIFKAALAASANARAERTAPHDSGEDRR